FFGLAGYSARKAKTASDAEEVIAGFCSDDEDHASRWAAICDLWSDLQDPETRADYMLKSIPKAAFQDCIGKYFAKLDVLDDYDVSEFIDVLLEEYPDLERD